MPEEINFRCKECRVMLTCNRAYINTKIQCLCKEENIVPPISEKPISEFSKNKDAWDPLEIIYTDHVHYMLPIHNAYGVLEKGIFCHTLISSEKISHEDFSDLEVQNRREKLIPGTTKRLHDFVPLYFETHTPMQYRWTRETKKSMPPLTQESLVFYEVDVGCVFSREGIFFSDGNAASEETKFFCDKNDLNQLDWKIIRNRKCFSKEYRRKKAAEVLVPEHVPIEWFTRVVVFNSKTRSKIIKSLKKIERLFNEKGNNEEFERTYNFKVEIDRYHYYEEY